VIARTRLVALIVLVALGLVACGGNGGTLDTGAATTAAAEETTTTPPAEAALTRGTFSSGATVEYPANWISYGAGMSGSLELAIPQAANVSLRDAAASEWLYGPLWAETASLQEAWDLMAAGVGAPGLTTQTTTIDGRTIMYAVDLVAGASTLMAVAEVDGVNVSLFAPSLDGTLSAGTVAAILSVFATLSP
jgi:hypothetical protein